MELTFTNTVIEWRGPAPYYYLPLPEEAAEDVHDVRKMATYGWGVIPVVARIGDGEDSRPRSSPRTAGTCCRSRTPSASPPASPSATSSPSR